jgi:accessory colonization factor AcfC
MLGYFSEAEDEELLLSCILEKVHPAFFSPSGILTKQKVPKGIMKLVFSSSSLLTLI